jgi:hypothetical protein
MASSVLRLLTFRRPVAVVRFVIAAVVDPINRMFRRRPMAHVGEEIGVIAPTFANRNASGAVVFIAGAFGIIAPLANGNPSLPFWRSVTFSVKRPFTERFATKAPARSGAAHSQIMTESEVARPALAAAKPFLILEKRNGGQAAETLARDVEEARHVGCLNS